MAHSLKILICGGGIAGPSLAYWLSRSGAHSITIVERFPVLRATGAQVDLRAQGIEAIRRMGLLDEVRSNLVDEKGVAFVDAAGNDTAVIMANMSGKGAQSLTSEFEIMRGDLVRILYEATKERVEYVFGRTVEDFEEDEAGVRVRFDDGSSDTFDLLVGADGQGSRIRRAILPSLLDNPGEDPFLHLGLHMAYWFVPGDPKTDNDIRRSYLGPGGRMIMRRSHNAQETQAYFILKDTSPGTALIHRASVEQQKEFWKSRFRGAGWQTDRFLAGMDTADNFYSQEVVQVRLDRWHQGRVVLLGDAGYCPSPFSGMGTTASFVGSYILAGEVARSPNDLGKAFNQYEETIRPFVKEIQKVNSRLIKWALPETVWGIAVLHFIARVLCFLRVPYLLARFSRENKGGWALPSYPELNASL